MRIVVVATAVCLSIVGLSAAADVEAAIRTPVNIPAQELASALQALAKDRDFQLVYHADLIGTRRTAGAVGELTTEEALTQLLSGTGLTYRYLGDKAITIVSLADTTGSATRESSGTSPQTRDETSSGASSSTQEGKKNPSGGFRTAQVDQGENSQSSPVSHIPTSEGVQLDEIIVTAQKRAERLIDTPQSVSVLSADSISQLAAVQFRDFANTVPGLTFTTAGAGRTQVSLRGITTGQDVSSTVGIYLDDVPVGSSSAFAQGNYLALDAALFDLDRIEVLRGPQGTLYGASTMGGLIKYVSPLPDSTTVSGHAQTGISSTESGGANFNVAGAVNLPLVTDELSLRIGAFESRDGGYINNAALGKQDVNRSDIYGGRLDLLYKPNDALSIRVGGLLQDISRDGQATTDYSFSGEPLYGELGQYRPTQEPFHQQFRLVSGTLSYDFGRATLTSISAYQTMLSEPRLDASAFYVPYLTSLGFSYSAVGIETELQTDKFTQELRLASTGTQALEWLIGGFYTGESSSDNEHFNLYDLAGALAPNDLYTASYLSHYREYAGFGDLTYHLTSKFDVSAGVRYARNSQDFTQIGSGSFIRSRPTSDSDENVVTYLANARYHLTPSATAYLRYATGYRPGGPNFVLSNPSTGLPIAPSTFQSDRLKSYEAGLKFATEEQRLAVDLAGYYIDWSNIQVIGIRDGIGFRLNAPGGATVRGTELTLTTRPIRGVTLSGAFAYQDARMSAANPDLGSASGERLPNVPHFTAAINGDYELPLQRMQPTVGFTVRSVSNRMASFDNGVVNGYPQYELPSYTTIDLRAGFVFGRISTQLYVHNLSDKFGQLSADTSWGDSRVAILQPRTVGIALSTLF